MAGCAAALTRAALPTYRGKHKSKIVQLIWFVEIWSSKRWIDPLAIHVIIDKTEIADHVTRYVRISSRKATAAVAEMATTTAWLVVAGSKELRRSHFMNVLRYWSQTGLDDSERDVVVARWVVKDMERASDRRIGDNVRKAALAAAVVGNYTMAAYLMEKAG